MKRIKFQRARFRNFLSYGNTWQEFDFNNGLSIIQGQIIESGKSNGSGKSSLTELIPFVLFGKTIKKIKKADIINWFNGKQCEVQLSFTIDDIPYEIRRGIKPNKLEVYRNGSQLPKLASAVDFQNQIEEEIIGMTFNTFQNLIYFSPNNTISIINASKPDKRKFLESLFDLSIYSKMLETTNAKIKTNKENTTKLIYNRDSLTSNIAKLQDEVDKMVIPNLRKNQNTIKGMTFQIEELEKVEFEVDDVIKDTYSRSYHNAIETHDDFQKQYEKAKAQINLHTQIIRRIPDLDEIKKKRDDILNEITLLEKSKFTDLEDGDLTDDIQAKELMKEELKQIISEIQKLDVELTHVDNQLLEQQDDLHKLETSAPLDIGDCDRCGQPITADVAKDYKKKQKKVINDKIKSLQVQIDTKIQKINEYKNEKEELYEKVKVEAERISSVQEDIRIKRGAEETLKRLRERLDDINDIEEEEEALVEGQKIIKENEKLCLDLVGKIHMAEIDLEDAKTKFNEMEQLDFKRIKHEEKLESLKKELVTELEHFKELEKIADNINEDMERKHGEIHTDETALEQVEARLKKANTLMDYLNYVRVSLKDENVKRFAISSLIPYLNKQTNHYLTESGFPYVVNVDSWLDVEIRGLGVQNVSYGNLSGGETKCIDMAVQLACNDIASMMASTSLNIMILDEVLDSSVDSLGVQALLNIIRVRQSKNNDAVYVITHRNEIDEFTFDSIVRIMNEDKFSKVEVS